MTTSKFTQIWHTLQQQAQSNQPFALSQAFIDNPHRFDAMHAQCGDLLYDYSKNLINENILNHLLALADAADIHGAAKAMRQGEPINYSENRAVLHTALRIPSNKVNNTVINGQPIHQQIHQALNHAIKLADDIIAGNYRLHDKPITDLVHIGIGGSDLGPRMATHALAAYHQRVNVHFIANADPEEIGRLLPNLDPSTTLFSVASKSFRTPETLMNAETVRTWLTANGIDATEISQHFITITSRPDNAINFGIQPKHVLPMFDWVGGRYSVWSTIGFPLMVAIGGNAFYNFLNGAYQMDEHFFQMPYHCNIPVLMALIGIWYNNFYHLPAYTVVPYSHALNRFPAYLQQLDMESNGKNRHPDGRQATFKTGPIVFGEEGVNSQHAYFQLLHQGTDIIPVDFIVPLSTPYHEYAHQHRFVVANAFAQAEALMVGKTKDQALAELAHLSQTDAQNLAPQRTFSGNRPSSIFLLPNISPFSLGQIMAAYEHKIFTQGIIWGINSFDQWGVEYGKQLAQTIETELANHSALHHDSSTNALIEYYRQFN